MIGPLEMVPFSIECHSGRPFVAFEWGSEVLYALAYRAAGLAGVAVLAGLVLALAYAMVARFLIRRGGDPLLAYLVSMAAAVLSAALKLSAFASPCAVALRLPTTAMPGRASSAALPRT